ncbi:DUF4232 domain-containing protein [Streptomyces scopuliridis]|uniref:DUF4232 domain-containing protein n=1 Tax=Streptomyces scopuliridis RB72 TaxID=1440053 RepID=A0A2T7TFG6_9ACTN|nr:DUF4232 domain-containing protein [Streptomyces scopuliridis]PVE13904.1 hypothetical protein Y717_03930 [Streptomyces scopuliridis RB72]
MRKHRIRTTTLAAAVLVAALSLTACQGEDSNAGAAQNASSSTSASAGTGATVTSGSSAENTSTDTSQGSGTASEGSTNNGSASTGSTSTSTSGSTSGSKESGGGSSGSGDKSGYGQVCGANDISWSTKSETQAGGYILVIAKANPGITCVLPAALPTVAFGSDGTQAGPAEQAVGEQITLSGSTTAYAGVNPKTTNQNGGKELDSIIVGIGDNDPNPVSLPVGTITVEDPIVTNWHTSAADAVPFSS